MYYDQAYHIYWLDPVRSLLDFKQVHERKKKKKIDSHV